MTDLEKLTKYVEQLVELRDLNTRYKDVTITLPANTVITEKWHNGNSDRFHEVQFPFSEIEDINKRLYDKIRYGKIKIKGNVE